MVIQPEKNEVTADKKQQPVNKIDGLFLLLCELKLKKKTKKLTPTYFPQYVFICLSQT